ncbi:hypothetical protein DITRI_Ditri02bG0058600 [Diplodiscus trichospermus]
MVSGMRYWQTSYEKAPALVISHKKPSLCPRLETIFEEGSELNFFEVGHKIVSAVFSLVIPVSLSIISYVLLYRDFA